MVLKNNLMEDALILSLYKTAALGGKKRYYHKKYKGMIQKFVKEYRLGLHEVEDPKKIKVVKKH